MAGVRFLRTAAFLFGFISFLDFHDENSNERETRHQSVGLMATSLNYTKGKNIHKNTETFRLVFWYLKILKGNKSQKTKKSEKQKPQKTTQLLVWLNCTRDTDDNRLRVYQWWPTFPTLLYTWSALHRQNGQNDWNSILTQVIKYFDRNTDGFLPIKTVICTTLLARKSIKVGK